jgi:TIR domain/Trypsin-like peptidase domain
MHLSRGETFAIGELWLPDQERGEDSRALGTTFAVTKSKIITAFHCIGNRRTESLLAERFVVVFGEQRNSATVVRHSVLADVALLELEDEIPSELVPVPLISGIARHTPFVIIGYQTLRQLGPDPIAASGEIVQLRGTIHNGTPVVQLFCKEGAAGRNLHGYSGAPTLVPTTSGDAAIGVIRCNPDDPERPGRPEGGTVFACPVTTILELWPELAPCLVDAVVPVAYEYAVSYCTDPNDVHIGTWIAQVLDDSGHEVFTRSWHLHPGDHYVEVLKHGFSIAKQVLVVVSARYLDDDNEIHLAERRIINENRTARRIPVTFERSVKIPDFLQDLTPLDLLVTKGDEQEVIAAIKNIPVLRRGRPLEDRPFPDAQFSTLSSRKNRLSGALDASKEDLQTGAADESERST